MIRWDLLLNWAEHYNPTSPDVRFGSKAEVQRTFTDFDDFWTTTLRGSSVGPTIGAMAPGDVELLKRRVRTRLPPDATGRITYSARANAVKGRVPN